MPVKPVCCVLRDLDCVSETLPLPSPFSELPGTAASGPRTDGSPLAALWPVWRADALLTWSGPWYPVGERDGFILTILLLADTLLAVVPSWHLPNVSAPPTPASAVLFSPGYHFSSSSTAAATTANTAAAATAAAVTA